MLWEWRLQGPGRPHGLRCAAGGDSASRGQGRSTGLGDGTKSGRGRSRVSDAPGARAISARQACGRCWAGPLGAPGAGSGHLCCGRPACPGPSGNLDSLSRASTFSLRVMDLERKSHLTGAPRRNLPAEMGAPGPARAPVSRVARALPPGNGGRPPSPVPASREGPGLHAAPGPALRALGPAGGELPCPVRLRPH